jgi:nucleoid DNA-binding protein
MNKKITQQPLGASVAEKANIDQKEAELFLKELIQTIQETVLNEDSLRIKNLGTFKRTEIKARESIDATTGRRIEIPAHDKISFVPDKLLADAVNEPFALFDSVELDNKAEPEKNTDPLAPSENRVPLTEPPYQPMEIDRRPPHKLHRPSSRRRRKNRFNTVIYSALVLALIGLLAWLYLLDRSDLVPTSTPDSAGYFLNIPDSIAAPDATEVAAPNTIPAPPPSIAAEKATTPPPAPTTKEYTIRPGDRLTKIALSEYGNKIFWVYLYEENKNRIENPNKIPVGTRIRIPPASQYGIDKDDPQSVRNATEIQQKYNPSSPQ